MNSKVLLWNPVPHFKEPRWVTQPCIRNRQTDLAIWCGSQRELWTSFSLSGPWSFSTWKKLIGVDTPWMRELCGSPDFQKSSSMPLEQKYMSFNVLECMRRTADFLWITPFLKQLSLEQRDLLSPLISPLQGKGSMVDLTPSFPAVQETTKVTYFSSVASKAPNHKLHDWKEENNREGQIKFSEVIKGQWSLMTM